MTLQALHGLTSYVIARRGGKTIYSNRPVSRRKIEVANRAYPGITGNCLRNLCLDS